MRTYGMLSIVCVCTVLLSGCVAQQGNLQVAPPTSAVQTEEPVSLVCAAAIKLGCRRKGTLYPWNAWVEMNGYRSTDYEVKEVVQTGNRATVVVVKR